MLRKPLKQRFQQGPPSPSMKGPSTQSQNLLKNNDLRKKSINGKGNGSVILRNLRLRQGAQAFYINWLTIFFLCELSPITFLISLGAEYETRNLFVFNFASYAICKSERIFSFSRRFR